MKPDDSRPTDAAEGDACLDGLAGRGGSSPAAREGARLREALLPSAQELRSIDPPAWQDIVTRARQPGASGRNAASPVAANHWRWWRTAGGVALVAGFATTALWMAHAPDESSSATLRGTSTPGPSTWRTESPLTAARDLAQQLEAAGARVTLTPSAEGALLDIRCEGSACQQTNELLARLEAAVDARGRVTVQVLPPK